MRLPLLYESNALEIPLYEMAIPSSQCGLSQGNLLTQFGLNSVTASETYHEAHTLGRMGSAQRDRQKGTDTHLEL